jgi:hypothetical protein
VGPVLTGGHAKTEGDASSRRPAHGVVAAIASTIDRHLDVLFLMLVASPSPGVLLRIRFVKGGKYERDMKLIDGTAMIEAGGSI